MSSSPSPADAAAPRNDGDAAPAPQVPDHRPSGQSTPDGGHTPSAATDDDNSHRCFICLVDESDADLPSDWVTPCTCTLEGHQSCLLTWVADLEMQGKSVKCPVCKSAIVVVDRWDPAVHLSDTLTRYLSGLSPWLLLSFGLSGVMMSSALYGMHALEMFAGPERAYRYVFPKPESERILDTIVAKLRNILPSTLPKDTAAAREMVRRDGIPMDEIPLVDWMHVLSLTLIAPALVLNRMHLGDTVMIPSSLMYAMFFSDHKADMFVWPPSPGRVLAAFPVVKAFYFQAYRSVSKSLDKKLAEATSQPRNLQGETAEEADARRQVAPPAQPEMEEGEDLHLEFDLQLGNGGDEAPEDPPPDDGAEAAQPNRQVTGLGSLLNYLAGALLWPTVSYGAGSLLRLVLPKPWVTKPSSGPVTGLLQERWGRSLVGGCLFVVLKDAFFLYVKYRRTINRPYRRIRNVDRRPR